MDAQIAAVAIVVASVIALVGHIYGFLVSKPNRVRSNLEKQGIKGPKPSSLLLGNIPEIMQIKAQLKKNDSISYDDDWPCILFPHLKLWQKQYGRMYLYSTGNMQMLSVTDPNIIREVILNPVLDLGKPAYLSKDRGPLLGQGIVTSSGSYWQFQRKVIAPEFFPDKIKGMVSMMVESTTAMLDSWDDKIKSNGGTTEITVDGDLRNLSQDIISKSAFGSNYNQGKHIFAKMRTLQQIMAKSVHVGIPGSRFMPTKSNWQIKRLEKEIHKMILKVVKDRMNAKHETDFLQKILEAAKMCADQNEYGLKVDVERLIVDNCKNIYFAGHETTACSAAWCLMLLATHPDWLTRARAEVLEVCQGGIPTIEEMRNMKVLTIIIQEALRLYPPGIFVTRTALEDAKLNGIQIPKGIDIQVPVALMHHDPEFWGEDVHKFNPERFANGISAACKAPQAYMPFGAGARVCLGQHFAMVELKIVLAMVLSRFSFSLSPQYRHSPAFTLLIEPEYGVKLVMKKA